MIGEIDMKMFEKTKNALKKVHNLFLNSIKFMSEGNEIR